MMTREQAKLFFDVNDEVDILDFYEEQLFEYKQFFLAKAPIQKVFVAKLEKLIQMDKAYRVLADLSAENYKNDEHSEIIFSKQILEAFQLFEQQKGKFKLQIMQAKNAKDVTVAVTQYLAVVKQYRQMWMAENELDMEFEGVLSKEPDPMEVLNEIRSFQLQGGKEFNDITKIGSNSFLINEMKRVSLLYKNYGG